MAFRWQPIGHIGLLAGGIAVLAACGTLPGSAPVVSPDRAYVERRTVSVFSIEGRLAAPQGERQLAARLSWQHRPGRDDLLLTNPLGQGLAELSRDAAGARLRLADQREFVATDWEALAQQFSGLSLPLSSLPRWLTADLPGEARRVQRDALGRPRSAIFQDWQIDYLDYESDHPQAMPTRIELHRGDLDIRLKIDEWQFDVRGAES